MKRAALIVLLALSTITPLLPADALHQPHALDEPPERDLSGDLLPVGPSIRRDDASTGYMAVDDELEALWARQDAAVAGLNRELAAIWGTLKGPPALGVTQLLDTPFAPGREHGGLGNWTTRGAADGWSVAATDGDNWTQAFTGQDQERYPPDSDTLLLSPEINLETLAGLRQRLLLDREDPLAPLGYQGDDPVNRQDLYTLFLVHRFNLATSSIGGLDGARVEVFEAPVRSGDSGTPLPPTPLPYETDPQAFSDAFGARAFTGESDWRVDAFDLQPWAGQTIRLGFHVKTLPADGKDYFDDPTYFETDQPRGWFLGHAEIRAPALPERVVVGDPLSPTTSRFEVGIPEPAPGPVTFEVPVWNLGFEPANLTIQGTVTRGTEDDPKPVLADHEETLQLPGGGVHTVQVNVTVPKAPPGEQVVWLDLIARTDTPASTQQVERFEDGDPGTRRVPAWVHVYDDVSGVLQVDPQVADPGDPRTAILDLANDGNAPEQVSIDANLRLHEDNTTHPAWFEADRHLKITLDPGENRTLQLPFRVPKASNATLQVNATWESPDGSTTARTWNTTVHTGVLPDLPASVDPQDLSNLTAVPQPCDQDGGDPFACPASGLIGALDGAYWEVGGAFKPVIKGHLAAPGECRVNGGEPRTREEIQDVACPREETPEGFFVEASELLWPIYRGEAEEAYTDPVIQGYTNLSLSLRHARAPADSIEIRFHVRGPLERGGEGGFSNLDTVFQAIDLALLYSREMTDTVTVTVPDDDGLGQGALAGSLRNSWHETTVDVSRALAGATGVQDAWRLGIEEMAIVGHGSEVALDDINLTGIPVDHPEQGRVTILRSTALHPPETTAAPTPYAPPEPDRGIWEVDGWQRATESGISTEGWRLEDRGDRTVWRSPPSKDPNIENRLTYTTPQPLPPMETPVLRLDHTYNSPPDRWLEGEDEFRVKEGYTVQAQFLPPGCQAPDGDRCRWSNWHWVQPQDGYPRPLLELPDGSARDVSSRSNIEPGDGFYHPLGPIVEADGDRTLASHANGSGRQIDTFQLTPQSLDGLNVSGRVARFAFVAIGGDSGLGTGLSGHGWFLRSLSVVDAPLANDLQVGPVRLESPYDVEEMGGVGPGSPIPVRVQVNNTGTRAANGLDLTLDILRGRTQAQACGPDAETADTLQTELTLPARTRTNHTFLWVVPQDADGDWFCLTARAEVPGRPDQTPADNVYPREDRRADLAPIPARRVVDLEIRQHVAPRDTPAGVTRLATVEIRNHGNTPAKDVAVTRSVDRLAGDLVRVRQDTWTLDNPVPPGTTWLRLDDPILEAEHVSQPGGREAMEWTPGTPGRHRILVSVTGGGELQADRGNNRAVLSDDALDIVFRDDLDTPRVGGIGTYQTQGDDLWTVREGAGFRSARGLWVGGGTEGYPDDADTTRVLPGVDLTRAKGAVLSFYTTYATEPGYDGALVEGSSDGGETWHPITPQGGYPHPLSASNPAVPDGDPRQASHGFTGTPPADQALDGWLPVSIPLDQIPGFTVPETLADLSPPAEPEGKRLADGSSFYDPSWVTGDGDNLERFEVQNDTLAEPTPPDGGRMWYSGTQGHVLSTPVDTTLETRVPVPASQPTLLLRFWDWRDGITPNNRSGTGGLFDVTVRELGPDGTPGALVNQTSVTVATDEAGRLVTRGDWTLREVRVPASAVDSLEVLLELQYASGVTDGQVVDGEYQDYRAAEKIRSIPGPNGNRGWAVTNLTVLEEGPFGEQTAAEQIPMDEGAWETSTLDGPFAWSLLGSIREYSPPPGMGSPTAPGGWQVASDDTGGLVWQLAPPEGRVSLAPNLDTRLTTPVIDLTNVAGDEASLALRHRWSFTDEAGPEGAGSSSGIDTPLVNGGAVEVQVFNETTGRFDPWQLLLPDPGMVGSLVASCRDCDISDYPAGQIRHLPEEAFGKQVAGDLEPYNLLLDGIRPALPTLPIERWVAAHADDPRNPRGSTNDDTRDINILETIDANLLITGQSGWQDHTFDLSPYMGQRVRLALHGWANPAPGQLTGGETWEVAHMEVRTEILEGGPVDLRFHFGSDGSVRGDGFGVDDLRVGTLAYERNLGLTVDQDAIPKGIGPGGTFWVNGTIENRGAAPRTGVGVNLSALDDRPGVTVQAVDDGDLVNRSAGPFALAPGGEQGSTDAFAFRVQLDEDAPLGSLPMSARLVDGVGDRARPVFDEVGGNKEDRFTLDVIASPRLSLEVDTQPKRALAGDPVEVHARVKNTGPVALETMVWLNVTRGNTVVDTTQTGITLLPNQAMWFPEDGWNLSSLEEGSYEVQAAAVGSVSEAVHEVTRDQASAHNRTGFHVGGTLRPFGTSFEDGLSRVEPYTVGHGENCDEPAVFVDQPPERPEKASHQWATTDQVASQGAYAALFGILPGRGTYQPLSDSALQTVPVDPEGRGDLSLSFFHQPHFGPGDGAIIEMRLKDPGSGQVLHNPTDGEGDDCYRYRTHLPNSQGWFLLTPEGGYPNGTTTTSTPTVRPPGGVRDGHLNALGDGHPVLGGDASSWERVSISLDDQILRAPDGTTIPAEELQDLLLEFRLRATTQYLEREGSGWLVDRLTVTPHGVDLEAGAPELPLTNGGAKLYNVAVHNPSAYDDRYDISIDWNATTVPRDNLELLNRNVTVPAGETGIANVSVQFPVDASSPSGSYTISLVATSQADPLLADVERLDLVLETTPHPDLVPRLETGGDRFEVGSTADLGAVVVNAGDAPSPTSTVRFTATRPDGTGERLIAEAQVPPIAPPQGGGTSQAVVSANWTVPQDELGPFRIRAEVDPVDQVVEGNESNNVVTRRVEVVPLQRPDLEVLPTDIELLDLSGTAAPAFRPLDIVQVVGKVRNQGNQPAPNTQANVFLGPSLATQAKLGTIPAGGEESVSVTVFAPGNTTTVTMSARSPASELREDNNEASHTLLVQDASLSTVFSSTDLTLAPGATASTDLEVTNDGSVPILLRVRPHDTGLEVSSQPEELVLPPGATRATTVEITAPPEIAAGEHEVSLLLERDDGGGAVTDPVTVTIPRVVEHHADPARISTPPGRISLPVTVTNEGNVPDDISLSLPPDQWATSSGIDLHLEPGQTRQTTVHLASPNSTPPGTHPLMLHLGSSKGFSDEVTTNVTIEPTSRVTVNATRAEAAGGRTVEHVLRATNQGNVPVRPFLSIDASVPGWETELELPARSLPPGGSAEGNLRLTSTDDPGPGIVPLAMRAQPVGEGTRALQGNQTVVVGVDARPASLTLDEVTRSPRFTVQAGQQVHYTVPVENLGSGPAAPVDVWLYVDEELADHTRLDRLDGHSEATVNLSHTAKRGDQSVVVSVDPQDLVTEFEEEDNAVAFVLSAEGGAMAWLREVPVPAPWLAVAVALLLWRRREL